jgi:hypothetical protein
LAAKGHADRLQRGDQSTGFAGVGGDELRHTLGKDMPPAGRIPTHEFAHRELDADRARAPGEIRQATLIATMD